MLQYHREHILLRKATRHLARLWRDGQRVAVVDHDGLNLGAKCIRRVSQQVVANGHHVDGARRALAQQLGTLQGAALHREVARARKQHPARALAPGTRERWQAGDGAHRVATAAHALHPVVHADGGGPDGAVGARQSANLLHGQGADLGRTLGRPLQRSLLELLPAERVLRQVVVVQPVVHDQFVHQRQRQRRIGARQQLQVLVAFLGGFRLARVDADEARTLALGLLGVAPEMQSAGDGIASPDEDELGLGEELHLHPHLAPQRLRHGLAACGCADAAMQQRRAQAVEEAPVHALALHQAHGAGVAVRHDGFGVACGNLGQARGDVGQGFVPADLRELAAAFGAAALERREDAVLVVSALRVFGDLGAEHAAGLRVRRIALHAHGHAVLHRGQQGAGVRAVVRTGAAHGVAGNSRFGRGFGNGNHGGSGTRSIRHAGRFGRILAIPGATHQPPIGPHEPWGGLPQPPSRRGDARGFHFYF